MDFKIAGTRSFVPLFQPLNVKPGRQYQVIELQTGVQNEDWDPSAEDPFQSLSPMLILSRHRDESIIIGDDIVITVVDIRGDKVRLGINAPIEIPVHRQEVYEAIQRENEQAARINPPGQREQKPPEPSKQ